MINFLNYVLYLSGKERLVSPTALKNHDSELIFFFFCLSLSYVLSVIEVDFKDFFIKIFQELKTEVC